MPGHEVIDHEEQRELNDIFERGGGVLFRMGFDSIRNGSFKVKEFEKAFANHMEVPFALAVTSGTAALRVALAALEIGRGDEVITQSFTFVATVEAIVEAGAIPICTEVDETLNMDPDDLERKITPKTKAIIPVHMLGTPARMDRILEIGSRYNIPILEDSAWGCGGKYKGIPLGTLGKVGTYSFDFAKTITTGEGGMVVSRLEELDLRARAWHDHGHHNNPQFPRWEDTRSGTGFNYRMTELQGAVGLAQLSKLNRVVDLQRQNKKAIEDEIIDLPIKKREVPEGSLETADALLFFVDTNESARRCRDALLQEQVGTKILPEAVTWHYAATWNHIPSLVNANGKDLTKAFPRSNELLSRSVSIPINVKMAPDTPKRVRRALTRALM